MLRAEAGWSWAVERMANQPLEMGPEGFYTDAEMQRNQTLDQEELKGEAAAEGGLTASQMVR